MALYTLGSLQFTTELLEVHETEHSAGSDYAPKDVIQSGRPREWMGEKDETLIFHSALFPTRIGGLHELLGLMQMMAQHIPYILIRGDGTTLGSFFIEHVDDHDTFLDTQGQGRLKEVTMHLVRCPDVFTEAAKAGLNQTAQASRNR